jgi:hypothetical protein
MKSASLGFNREPVINANKKRTELNPFSKLNSPTSESTLSTGIHLLASEGDRLRRTLCLVSVSTANLQSKS